MKNEERVKFLGKDVELRQALPKPKNLIHMNLKQIFHYISYLQYPLMIIALYYAFKPYFTGLEEAFRDMETVLAAINNMMVFMGLGVSFSTLQDTEKTQNKVSRKIWEDPQKGKIFIGIFAAVTAFVIITGLVEFIAARGTMFEEVSFGMIVLGLGFLGMLKAMVEMHENHRKDRKEA